MKARRKRLDHLGIDPVHTVEEIAALMGVTAQYISYLEHQGLAKIEKNLTARGLTWPDFRAALEGEIFPMRPKSYDPEE